MRNNHCIVIDHGHLAFFIFQQLGEITINPSTSVFEKLVMGQKKWSFEFVWHKTPAGAARARGRPPGDRGELPRGNRCCAVFGETVDHS